MSDLPPATTAPCSPGEARLTKNQQMAHKISRDLRTDTITVPTEAMLDVMRNATMGDAVYDEDEMTVELEKRIAKLAGKEAALFAVSGTMTNQLALRTHLHQPPHSVILDSRSHIHNWEAGGLASHSAATTFALPPLVNGHHLTLEDILPNIIPSDEEDIHMVPTKIVALEQTLSGMIFPPQEIEEIAREMKSMGIILHCDGARMWEAVAKTGKSLQEMCAPFDSVSLCMSKGLGAPVGSMLVGPAPFIRKAKNFRKLFGGAIRQSGSLAAAVDFALTNNLPLLGGTHKLATQLAKALVDLGVKLLLPVETNMLWIDPTPLGFSLGELQIRAAAHPNSPITLGGSPRIVIHYQVAEQAIEDLIELVQEMKRENEGKAKPLTEAQIRCNELYAQGKWEGRVDPLTSSLLDAYKKRTQ